MSGLCLCSEMAAGSVDVYPRCFASLWLFEGVPPEAMGVIAKNLVRRDLAAGEELFRQGVEPRDPTFRVPIDALLECVDLRRPAILLAGPRRAAASSAELLHALAHIPHTGRKSRGARPTHGVLPCRATNLQQSLQRVGRCRLQNQ